MSSLPPKGRPTLDEATKRFEELYDQHFRAVLRFALVRVDPDMAKDVVAETFFVAWRRLADLPAEPRAWLLGVARKVIAGQLRSATRLTALRARILTMRDEDDSSEFAHRLVEREEVLAALDALRPSDRDVLVLVAWDDLAPADAAQVLGISKASFAVRLHRARRRFAAALADFDRPGPGTASSHSCVLSLLSEPSTRSTQVKELHCHEQH